MAHSYIIRRYTPADALGVHEVLNATYGAEATPKATFDWWSFGCPTATSGFMVADLDGRIVGVQPMEVFPFTDHGARLKGGLLTGVAVRPECRRQGIFSALVQACEQEAWRQGADFVTTMPNERSRPGFLKMGYVEPGRRRLLIRPLETRALARRAVPVALLGSAGGVLAGFGQALLKPASRKGGFSIEETAQVPEDIEEVSEAHAGLFPGLRVHRSRGWWEWRYLQAPLRKYRLFVVRELGKGTSGFAVTTSELRHGLPVAYLMDLVVRNPGVLNGLSARVFDAARMEGAQLLCCVASSTGMIRALRRAGFWLVPQWAPVKRFYTVVRFNPDTANRLPKTWQEIGYWYQVLGDWDNL